MSNLIRDLAGAAKAAYAAYEDAAKKGKQEYNREQSRRSAGRYKKKETPEEYNKRKARELRGMKPEHPMDRFASS